MPTTEAEPRVAALVEALPYVQRWAGRTVVVKYGGAALDKVELAGAVVEDVVLLQAVGVRVALVHGGGPAVSEMSRKLGIEPRFIDGLRVTDEATLRVAQLVQIGGISRDILAALARRGGRAIGLSGHDLGGWLRAKPIHHISRETGEPVDLGRVGDVERVDAAALVRVLDAGLVPVIAPVAVDDALDPLNVNADTVACAVAGALKADKLVFLTDTPGIRGPDGIAPEVDRGTLGRWIASGVVSGGMIPKAEAAMAALDAGVGAVTVADGTVPHAVLVELFTDRGSGTLVKQ